MAALAQAVPVETLIREALGCMALPSGMELKSVEFRGNSYGEPSVYVIYSYAQNRNSDEEQAKIFVKVIHHTLDILSRLDLPLFEYVNFVAA